MEQSSPTKWWAIGLLLTFVIVGLWGYRQQSNQTIFDTVYIAQGFETGVLLKQAVAYHYAYEGKLPESNDDVDLGSPDIYANGSLQTAAIIENGIIELTYDAKSGVDGGVVRLVPTVVPGMLNWQCETHDYQTISKYMPQCLFIDDAKTEVVIAEQVRNILPISRTDKPNSETQTVVVNINDLQCDDKNKPMLLGATFTRKVVNAVPIDHLQSLGLRQQELYFYSTVVGGMEQKISHRWLFNNQPMQEQNFTLGDDQFPVWSKQLLANKQGDWEVQVWAQGCLLERFSIASSNKKNEAQIIGIDKSHSWHKPEDVLDTIIINSANALVADQHYVAQSWMINNNYWDKEREVSGVYSDDITNYIRSGDGSVFTQTKGKFNYDRRNAKGDTPLIEAIKAGQEQIAISLLSNGANPFIRGVDGSKPYNLAVERNMDELTAAMLGFAETEELWVQGKSERFHAGMMNRIMSYQKWQQRNALGDTPLLLAARLDNDWAVAVLLQKQRKTDTLNLNAMQLNPFINDHIGKRANELAQEQDNMFAEALIEKYQSESKAPWQIIESAISTGMKGDRPLDCVAKQDLEKSVTFYYYNRLMDTSTQTLRHKWFYQNRLIKDVQPNVGSKKDVIFSSHTLTEIDKGYWHIELVNEQGDVLDRMKLSYGERYTGGGGTPLSTPCLGPKRALSSLISGWQDPKLIAELLDAMDDFNPTVSTGLATAISSANISAVRLLLEHGVNINTPLRTSGHQKPPLLLAVQSGNPIMVKYLLHRGADVNQQGWGNSTALYQAVVERNYEIMALLLEHGADPTLISSYVDSLPLIKAANTCDIDSMTILHEHGASFEQKTKKGITALDIVNRDCRTSGNWQKIETLTIQALN
ncbi:MAG: DUF2914 domain-containing protein [Methylophaga sp.]|nr:DUF2914 domain-containing protein [Methylophaga sp.]